MIMLVIFSVLLIYSFSHFKKAVFISATSLLFLPNVISGIPGVKMLYAISIWQIFLFYFKGCYEYKQSKYPLWLLIPSLLTCFGYIMSDIYGIVKNLPLIIVNCLCYFYYPYIIWHLLDSRTAVQLFIKYLLTFFSIVAIYALIEFTLGNNIIADICRNYELIEGLMGNEEAGERFGLLRCNSILPYSSALGMLSALMFFMLLNIKAIKVQIDKKKENILLLLLPFCVLLSGTRSQFCVFAICLIPVFFWKKFLKTKTSKILLLLFIVIIITFSGLFYDIVSSIIDSNNSKTEGSTSDLREAQLEICLQYFAQNPIWGNGRNYIWEYVRPYHPLLMGAESVWFPTMVDYGLVGCVNYLLVILGSIITLSKKSFVLCFFPLAFLFGKTVSIVIGVELSTLLIFTILLHKMYTFYEKK